MKHIFRCSQLWGGSPLPGRVETFHHLNLHSYDAEISSLEEVTPWESDVSPRAFTDHGNHNDNE